MNVDAYTLYLSNKQLAALKLSMGIPNWYTCDQYQPITALVYFISSVWLANIGHMYINLGCPATL